MKYMSETYYENLYFEILEELSGGNDFIKELLMECVFEDINKLNEDTPLRKKLLIYKKNLGDFTEGRQWPYFRKKKEDEEEGGFLRVLVGKESGERIRKVTIQVSDMLDEFNKFKKETIEKLRKRKKEGIIIGATLLSAIIIKKTYDIYQKHLHGSCAKYGGKERLLCEMKMLDGYREMLVKQIDNCKLTSHPVSCQKKLTKAIKKIDKKLIEFAEKLT